MKESVEFITQPREVVRYLSAPEGSPARKYIAHLIDSLKKSEEQNLQGASL